MLKFLLAAASLHVGSLRLVEASSLTGDLMPRLPSATRVLQLRHGAGAEDTCEVYLCGTAHVSSRSCDEVRGVIRTVQPDCVMIELCSQVYM